VHRRDFTAGTAIVNTSSSAAATVELGGTFLDHAGRAITRITLGPTRGAILRRVGADAPVPTPRPPTTPAPTPGRDVLVSTLTPTAPARNDWGPYERDRANGEQDPGDGGGLRIGNVAYAKGLGVHATSDVRFRVPAGCRSFQAKVGIDDEVGAKGSVTFEVWSGTKKKLYVSPVRTGSQGPLAVTVPLTGVSELRLVVRDAGDGDAFDHADWADARFTCS
jgi:alpha-galactosidase